MGAEQHRCASARGPRVASGFTLVEVLIVVAVIGILAAIAYPAYTDSIRKARRSEAITALGAIQQAQERHRSNNTTYANSLDALPAPKPVSPTPGGYYTLTVSGASATGYTATANATGNQASDAACTSLSVQVAGGTITYGKTGSAPDYKACWRQ